MEQDCNDPSGMRPSKRGAARRIPSASPARHRSSSRAPTGRSRSAGARSDAPGDSGGDTAGQLALTLAGWRKPGRDPPSAGDHCGRLRVLAVLQPGDPRGDRDGRDRLRQRDGGARVLRGRAAARQRGRDRPAHRVRGTLGPAQRRPAAPHFGSSSSGSATSSAAGPPSSTGITTAMRGRSSPLPSSRWPSRSTFPSARSIRITGSGCGSGDPDAGHADRPHAQQ